MKIFNLWGHLALCLLGSLWGTGLSLSAQVTEFPGVNLAHLEFRSNTGTSTTGASLMGASMDGSLNINHPLGTSFQDVKRAVFHLIISPTQSNPSICTATLLNTIVQNGKPYLLTAAHCISEFVLDESTEMYLTPNLEWMNETGDPTDLSFAKTHLCEVRIVLKDTKKDIALLEIINPESEFSTAALYNAYAAGWQLGDRVGNAKALIAHPRGDHKKLFINPTTTSEEIKTHPIGANPPFSISGKIWFTSEGWNGVRNLFGEKGSSGTALLNQSAKAIAVAVAGGATDVHNVNIPLVNSWFNQRPESSGTGPKGLIDFLDPHHTWVPTVPGGYRSDLIARDEGFSHTLNQEEALEPKELTRTLNNFDYLFYKNEAYKNLIYEINGLKVEENPGNAPVYLTIKASTKDDQEYLLYGAYADGSGIDPHTGFEEQKWRPLSDDAPVPGDFPPVDNRRAFTDYINFKPLYSNKLKTHFLNFLKLDLSRDAFTQSYKTERVRLKVEAFRLYDWVDSPVKLTAVGIPGMIPLNARYLFENKVPALRSYQYHSSWAVYNNDHVLQIKEVKLLQHEQVLETYTTGYNGGYLNLANPSYIHSSFRTSFPNFATNDEYPDSLECDISYDYETNKYFKAFLDCSHQPDASNHYNFTPMESRDKQRIDWSTGIRHHHLKFRLPSYEELEITPGATCLCRLRIALSDQDNLTQDGIYADGEVEDYLIRLQAPTVPEALAATAEIHIPLRTGEGIEGTEGTCGVPAAEPPADGPAASPSVNVGDATYPYACNSYTCSSADCNLSAVNTTDAVEGSYALDLRDDNDYIALDEGNSFIHEAFNSRSVCFWMKSDNYNGTQDLYEEGDPSAGLGLRINNGSLELGVRNNSSQFQQVSAAIPSTNDWVHVTAVFEGGKLSLYENGILQAENSNVGFTTVPNHPGEAGFGGTNQTNIFNEVNNTYAGLADEILIFGEPLSADQVSTLYQAGLQGSARNLAVESSAPIEKHPSTTAQARTPLLIFPNPAHDEVTLIVNLPQPELLQVRITDLVGRELYHRSAQINDTGLQMLHLNDLNLAPAPYWIQIQSKAGVQMGKLLIK
jgi:Concanavalin A-like lectin/glucanases superfamily